jgi:hypothetical protein
MTTMIRRFTIFTLIMALFAVAFASLAVNPHRDFDRVNVGSAYTASYR